MSCERKRTNDAAVKNISHIFKHPLSFVYKKKMIEGVEFVKTEAKTNLGDAQ